ncbi:MAG: hypothetical protein N4A49_07320 [Marinifilaceae bacterium]|jgi:hypothetical protein|nr:hypothetical protein [Marinifilaceae bacterium]
MKLKYKIISLIALVGFLNACDGEDELSPSATDETKDVSLRPGRAGEELDSKIEEIFSNTNTYFLYDFTEEEIKWNLVAGSAGGTVHLYENFIPTESENLSKQWDWISTTFLDMYPNEFLIKFLPYKIYMAGAFTNSRTESDQYQIAYTSNSLIFGFGNRQDGLSSIEKYNRINMEQNNYLNWLDSKNKLFDLFNPKFFSITDYTMGIPFNFKFYKVPEETNYNGAFIPTDQMLESGVLGSVSSFGDTKTKMSADARNYYNYMRFFDKDSPQWKRFLSFPKVKAKYDYFRNHCIENYSFDPHVMGEFSFE